MASDIRVQDLFPAMLCLSFILLPQETISYKYLVKNMDFPGYSPNRPCFSFFLVVILGRFNGLVASKYYVYMMFTRFVNSQVSSIQHFAVLPPPVEGFSGWLSG